MPPKDIVFDFLHEVLLFFDSVEDLGIVGQVFQLRAEHTQTAHTSLKSRV